MRRSALRHLLASACVALALTACSDNDPTAPTIDGAVRATIDGVPWSAAFATAVRSGDVIGVGANDLDQVGVGFAFEDLGPGTYTIGPGEVNNGLYNVGAASWNATQFQGSGEIVVTSVTDSRVAGTFAFDAVSVGQTPETTVRVTNGVFDLPLTDSGV